MYGSTGHGRAVRRVTTAQRSRRVNVTTQKPFNQNDFLPRGLTIIFSLEHSVLLRSACYASCRVLLSYVQLFEGLTTRAALVYIEALAAFSGEIPSVSTLTVSREAAMNILA